VDRAAFDPSKELRLMLAFFGEAQLPRCREIPADQIPEPCHRLLVHNKHMTVTLEEHYGEPVRVRPYLVRHEGDVYARKLDLVVGPDDLVIMTGIMMFNLSFATPEVREQIIEQRLPLGRILIAHNILREISTTSFLEIAGDDPLAARFGLDPPRAAYGRLATIFCNGNPAVDLLEIVRPEPSVRHHAPP
jgi:hypothetical protein